MKRLWEPLPLSRELPQFVWLVILLCPIVGYLISGLDVHSLPKVHATGSTMRVASGVTEMSNRYEVTPTNFREHRTTMQCRAQLLLLLLKILLAGGGFNNTNLIPQQNEV